MKLLSSSAIASSPLKLLHFILLENYRLDLVNKVIIKAILISENNIKNLFENITFIFFSLVYTVNKKILLELSNITETLRI